MKKKLTKKQKTNLRIMIFVVVCLVSLGSFLFIKFTTPPSLASVIEDVMFDTNEITLDVNFSNSNTSANYKFVVSNSSKYIKIEKEIDNNKEVSVLYYKDNQYNLFSKDTTIVLNENDGINLFNTMKKDVVKLKDYLSINYNEVKYYFYSKELVTFSNYDSNIFYDNELVINNNKLTNLKRVFTTNNVVNTILIDISYDVVIDIPGV